jgi:putative oxidoreductase
MRELFLVGRILVGAYYLFNAVQHFAQLSNYTQYAASKGVPLPMVATIAGGILLAIGGLTLLLGVYPKVGVLALALFLLPSAVMMHQFWNVDGSARLIDLVNFSRNLALLGSALMFLMIPEPWPMSAASRIHLPRRATT